MARLDGKVAIITGAASGIGSAAACLFAAEGATVVGTDVQFVDADAWRADCGDGALFLHHDVTDEGRWQDVIVSAQEHAGRIDILLNCAGINGVSGDEAPSQAPDVIGLDIWRQVNRVNTEGTLLGCRSVIPIMREGGGGAIVNISSIAAQKGWPIRTAYGASKAAVLQYTRSVARFCADSGWNIRCNAVLPGPIDTPMINPPGGKPLTGGDGQAGADHVPIKRYGDPMEVARPMLFLASDEASYITGAGLNVDGGIAALTAD
jgi:NAD(P)-dependent dehydrogenase (short-subunit alcohol dehydrogenase family)